MSTSKRDGKSTDETPEFPGPLPDDATLVRRSSTEEDLLFGAPEGQSDTGFDYNAFEESLEEIDQETTDDPPTDPGQRPDQVQQRFTLDMQRFPKDDATADTRELGNYTVVTIRGRINESFNGAELGARLRGNVVFDLTEVERVTSFGVRSWLQMMDAARLKDAVFVRASPAVVNQVTMMRNFCGAAKIHSILAPYACEACGAEFGVTYDAVDDRSVMRARNPLKVTCPSCSDAAQMDEDPWVFFALDEMLLEEVSADLQRVLENLGSAPSHPPIEKAVVGDTTRVRFNGLVNADTRFQRAFSGLEGDVAIDLRTASSVDSAGIDGLVQQLGRLPDEITRLVIEGAPPALIRTLLAKPGDHPNVYVASAAVETRSLARPLERTVIVDLKRERGAIMSGGFRPDVPWRDDPLEIADLDVLKKACEALIPPDVRRARTPVPAQRQPLPDATPAPMAGNDATNDPMAAAGPAGLGVFAALAGGGVIVGMLLAVVAGGYYYSRTTGTPAGSTTSAMPVPAELVAASGEWTTGGELPPPWSEVGIAQSGEQLLLAGHGSGDSLQSAAVEARREALDRLLTHAGANLVPRFEDEALPLDGPERAAALANFEVAVSTLTIERTQEATRRVGDRYEVVAQYGVGQASVDAFLNEHRRVAQFRGIRVAQSMPWSRAGVRLVERETYIRNVAPGDRLLTVGGKPADTLAAFESTTTSQFAAVPAGKALLLEFQRDGKPVTTEIPRPNSPSPTVDPVPGGAATPRPTLFKKD